MRVLICDQHGGFSLSRAAFLRLRELGNEHALAERDYGEMYDDESGPRKPFGSMEGFCREIARDDADLLALFDEMGQEAAGSVCRLKAVEIPDGVEWGIEEYDGLEWVAEKHRVWS